MYSSYIQAIDFFVPNNREFNDPDSKITQKIGIYSRPITDDNEYASDLACQAANKLFDSNVCQREEIEFLIYCTQSPDYYLPSTSCILQDRLGLPTSCGAVDINLGCSGFVYGLSLAKGMIESGMVSNVLLVTSDTYNKYTNPKDPSVRVLFGDASAATFISRSERPLPSIGPFVFGTDGSGAKNLIVPAGGLRERISADTRIETMDKKGNVRSRADMYMNGQNVFIFTLNEVTNTIIQFLEQNNESISDYDFFVFHQANEYMIKAIRDKLGIPEEKFCIQLRDFGNTGSSSIPIAIVHELENKRIKRGDKVMLAGFGVGYSWSACSITW
jgi:3-oxoacyl-[acyl-carrier-protein] synthase III